MSEQQVENLKDERTIRQLETVTSRLERLVDRLEKTVQHPPPPESEDKRQPHGE